MQDYSDYPELSGGALDTVDVPNHNESKSAVAGALPHSLTAEQSVLGGLILDGDQWDAVSSVLTEEHFYLPAHRKIYRTMESLVLGSSSIDVVSLQDRLERNGELDSVGGLEYLVEIARETPSASNILAYADVVFDRYMRRELIKAGNDLIRKAVDPDGAETKEVLQEAEVAVMRISESQSVESTLHTMNPLLRRTLDKLDEITNNGGGLTGLTTGFDEFDSMTGGLQESDLIILAARPSMGKTTIALNMVENALLASNRPIMVFSLEMPAEQLMNRMISSIGKIDQTRLRDGKLEEDDWPKLSVAVNLLRDKKLFIDDASGITPSEMRSRARRIKREQGDLALIVVDYLQLMQIKGKRNMGRVEEVSEISRSLKALAKEMKCPVVALSQLSRNLENRPNKRPINSDLRDSGAIEQDADLIVFVYRDEVYNEDSNDKGIAEIIIGKQRNGPIGTTRLCFMGQHSRFENLTTRYNEYNY